jgi:hypothetical protein
MTRYASATGADPDRRLRLPRELPLIFACSYNPAFCRHAHHASSPFTTPQQAIPARIPVARRVFLRRYALRYLIRPRAETAPTIRVRHAQTTDAQRGRHAVAAEEGVRAPADFPPTA